MSVSPMAMMQLTQGFAPQVDPVTGVIGQPNPQQFQQQQQSAGLGALNNVQVPPEVAAAFANPQQNSALKDANEELIAAGRAYQDAATPITTGLGRMGVIEGIARHFTSKDEKERYEAAFDNAQEQKFQLEQANARKRASSVYQMALPLVGQQQAQVMADMALYDEAYGKQTQDRLLEMQSQRRENAHELATEKRQEGERTRGYMALAQNMGLRLTPQQAQQMAEAGIDPADAMKLLEERQVWQNEQEQLDYDRQVQMIEQKGIVRNNARQVARTLEQVGPWSTGFASLLSALPGSPAYNLETLLDTQQAMNAFDRLQQMRQDPRNQTGGALGNVSNREIELLYSSFAAIKNGMSEDLLRTSLLDIQVAQDLLMYATEHEQKYFDAVQAGKMTEEQAAKMLENEAYNFTNERMMQRMSRDSEYTMEGQREVLEAVKAGEVTLGEFEAVFGWRPAMDGMRERF